MNDHTEQPAVTSTASSEPITFYELRFYPFSNFSAFALIYDGRLWPTGEHAYQAMKFTTRRLQELIREQTSAHAAMKLAQSMPKARRADWQEVKVAIMLEICRAKLHQHPYIQGKIVESGTRPVIESSPIDSFWGWGPNKDGENHLGKIWMTLRDEWNAHLASTSDGMTEAQRTQAVAVAAMKEELQRRFGHLPVWHVVSDDQEESKHNGCDLTTATTFLQDAALRESGNSHGRRLQMIFQ